MSRIPTPATIDAAPAKAQPFLEGVKKQLGVVPNMFRLISNSPASLEGYVGLNSALNKGSLPAATRERIALAVAEENRFAVKLVRERGHVGENDLRALRAAGYDDAQVIEIVLHVALNTWTNFINVVGATDIDFPPVSVGKFN